MKICEKCAIAKKKSAPYYYILCDECAKKEHIEFIESITDERVKSDYLTVFHMKYG